MKRIDITELSTVMGGQAADAHVLAQGAATVKYNQCVNDALNRSAAATSAAFSKVGPGGLTPTQGVQAGIEANRTLRSDVAACATNNPL